MYVSIVQDSDSEVCSVATFKVFFTFGIIRLMNDSSVDPIVNEMMLLNKFRKQV